MKKKWKNLRDTFAKFLKITKTKTGQAANTKKWIWADRMKAFRPFLAYGTTSTNISAVSLDEDNCDITFIPQSNFDEINFENTMIEESLDIEFESSGHSTPIQIIELSGITENKSTSGEKKTSKKRKSGSPTPVGRVLNYLQTKNNTQHDKTEYLMLAHAQTIKTFNPKRQAITKMKIAQLIMEQELLQIEENQKETCSSEICNNNWSSVLSPSCTK